MYQMKPLACDPSRLKGISERLALDMFQHSYHIEYGAKAAAYVDAWMQNINWQFAAERYGIATAR